MKTCGCCGQVHSAPQWAALQLVGNQLDGEGMIELRNCACGSTIAIEIHSGPGLLTESAADYLGNARTDIQTGYADSALQALRSAKERIETAIRQLEACAPRPQTQSFWAAAE